jgi:hypothetical protein
MKSDFTDLTPEEKLETAKSMLRHSSEKVAKTIDALTSSSLKKILKFTTHVHFAEAILEKKIDRELNPTEQKLIDYIFSLQEDVMGFQQLQKELMEDDPLKPIDQTNQGDTNV